MPDDMAERLSAIRRILPPGGDRQRAHARGVERDLPRRPGPAAPVARRGCGGTSRRGSSSCRAFARRLAYPPPGMGEPFWVDDPDFDVVAPRARARHAEHGARRPPLRAPLRPACSPSRCRVTARCGRSGSLRGSAAGAAGSSRESTTRSSTASRRSRSRCSSSTSTPTRRRDSRRAGRRRPTPGTARLAAGALALERRGVAAGGALGGPHGRRAARRPPRGSPARSGARRSRPARTCCGRRRPRR